VFNEDFNKESSSEPASFETDSFVLFFPIFINSNLSIVILCFEYFFPSFSHLSKVKRPSIKIGRRNWI
jgi:hypothetical protein